MKNKFFIFMWLFFTTGSVCYANWIPFSLENNHITIDIEFNGQPAKALLDSGAEFNAVNETYVKEYGKGIHRSGYINVQGVNGTQKRPVFSNVPIKLFGFELKLNKLAAVNLSNSAILLGAPFFNNFIVEIDYPNSRMQLFPKDAIDMDKYKNVKVDRERGSLLPAIEIAVNGRKVWLTLDTGNNGGLYMKRSYAVEKGWLNGEVEKGLSVGVNSVAEMETFTLDSLKIGPYELEGIPVMIPAEGQKSLVGRRDTTVNIGRVKRGKNTKGILGYDILKHFVMTIDYANYKVHLIAP